MLLTTWLAMAAGWRKAFAQDRSFHRVLHLLLGILATLGRGTVSNALGCFGGCVDWSADYRAFSRSDWDGRELFRGVISECAPALRSVSRIAISLDDTGLPKTSRKIRQVSTMRDPLGPKYRANFIRGLRCLHGMIHLPPFVEGLGATGISVGFELAPPPKKPKRSAPEEDWSAYREAQKTCSLTARGADMVNALRQDLDAAGLTQPMLCVVDGGYTNRTLIERLPDRADLIGRVRKDIRICLPAKGSRRAVYGEVLPTPEQLRHDGCLAIQHCECFYGQRTRPVQFKEMRGILWPSGARRRQMRLVIVLPTPYRPVGCRKLKYDQPAYLITTDHATPAPELIQHYLDRWEIEILHRELKTHVGLGQAQVWSEKSVTRLHPALVATYALLKLASIKAFGPTRTQDYHELPKWRSRKDREAIRKPSAHDLLTRLRADLAQQIHQIPLQPHEIHAVA